MQVLHPTVQVLHCCAEKITFHTAKLSDNLNKQLNCVLTFQIRKHRALIITESWPLFLFYTIIFLVYNKT